MSKAKFNTKQQLNFTGDLGNDTTTDCVALPSSDQTVLSKSGDSSSVVLLTPATQDIIFLDDTDNDFSDIDTMDLLADIRKHETAYMQNLKKYESKKYVFGHRQYTADLVRFGSIPTIYFCISNITYSQCILALKRNKNQWSDL